MNHKEEIKKILSRYGFYNIKVINAIHPLGDYCHEVTLLDSSYSNENIAKILRNELPNTKINIRHELTGSCHENIKKSLQSHGIFNYNTISNLKDRRVLINIPYYYCISNDREKLLIKEIIDNTLYKVVEINYSDEKFPAKPLTAGIPKTTKIDNSDIDDLNHYVNNDLAVIIGLSELFNTDNLTAEQKENIETIKERAINAGKALKNYSNKLNK